jgi:tetratricopeptide (TPR) repeat protein
VDRARELDPLCLATSTTATWTRYIAGDYEGAITQCRHTLEMDPEFVNAHRVLAAAQLQAGRPEDAAAQLELALSFADTNPVLLAWLAHVKAVTGCRAQAESLIARALDLQSSRYVPPFHLAIAYAGLGATDDALAALEQAWIDRDPSLAGVDAEPRLEPLRGEARYRELLKRLRIPGSRVEV